MIAWIRSILASRRRTRTMRLVSVHHADGHIEVGRVDWWGADFVMVHPFPGGVPQNGLPWTFDRATGRHVTWGMGRHDLDEWPRVELAEIDRLWVIAPGGGS